VNTQEVSISKNINNISEGNLIADEQIVQIAADLLKDNAQHLNAVTLQRLSTARNLAVNKLAARQTQAAQSVNQNGNILQWLGHGFEQHRMMSAAMIAGAMALTFYAIQQFSLNNNLKSGDAFLLASELPPEAFADKGFDTWLVSKQD